MGAGILIARTLTLTLLGVGSLPLPPVQACGLTDCRLAQANSNPLYPGTLDFTIALNRAQNLARDAAINANGGLSNYRPDKIMYGPSVNTPYRYDDQKQVFTFDFVGGAPGWQEANQAPTVRTVVQVTTDLPPQVTVLSNGPLQ